jgi:hypothetical protein
MSNPIPDLLFHDAERRILICLDPEHRYCLSPNKPQDHYKTFHEGMPESIINEIKRYAASLTLDPPQVVKHQALLPGSTVAAFIPRLAVHEGYRCPKQACSHSLVSLKKMHEHIKAAHRDMEGTHLIRLKLNDTERHTPIPANL